MDNKMLKLIKLALEYNAAIIANASLVFGQGYKPTHHKKVIREFQKMSKTYSKQIEAILNEPDLDGMGTTIDPNKVK